MFDFKYVRSLEVKNKELEDKIVQLSKDNSSILERFNSQ
jgi:hypothetical protein